MSIKEEINNLKQITTIDSSELSSDISEEDLQISTKINKYSPIQRNEVSFNGDFEPSYINNKKRSRFFSEDSENIFNNSKSYMRNNLYELKIKIINKQLKNIAKDELVHSKERKFTFS